MPNTVYTIRRAVEDDFLSICKFVDFWLSGKARQEGIESGGRDCFIPKGQQKDYLKNYTVVLAVNDDEILGWAVMQKDQTLIHLLVSGDYRNLGIGKSLLFFLNPKAIRSKTDQSTGNPNEFYKRQGYSSQEKLCTGKHHNIDVLKKPTE